jgi:hypothetical protein
MGFFFTVLTPRSTKTVDRLSTSAGVSATYVLVSGRVRVRVRVRVSNVSISPNLVIVVIYVTSKERGEYERYVEYLSTEEGNLLFPVASTGHGFRCRRQSMPSSFCASREEV